MKRGLFLRPPPWRPGAALGPSRLRPRTCPGYAAPARGADAARSSDFAATENASSRLGGKAGHHSDSPSERAWPPARDRPSRPIGPVLPRGFRSQRNLPGQSRRVPLGAATSGVESRHDRHASASALRAVRDVPRLTPPTWLGSLQQPNLPVGAELPWEGPRRVANRVHPILAPCAVGSASSRFSPGSPRMVTPTPFAPARRSRSKDRSRNRPIRAPPRVTCGPGR